MYLVFLTTNLFDTIWTLVADKKDSYLFIHVFRTKRVIYLAQIKQNGRVDAKNTLGANVFIFFKLLLLLIVCGNAARARCQARSFTSKREQGLFYPRYFENEALVLG